MSKVKRKKKEEKTHLIPIVKPVLKKPMIPKTKEEKEKIKEVKGPVTDRNQELIKEKKLLLNEVLEITAEEKKEGLKKELKKAQTMTGMEEFVRKHKIPFGRYILGPYKGSPKRLKEFLNSADKGKFLGLLYKAGVSLNKGTGLLNKNEIKQLKRMITKKPSLKEFAHYYLAFSGNRMPKAIGAEVLIELSGVEESKRKEFIFQQKKKNQMILGNPVNLIQKTMEEYKYLTENKRIEIREGFEDYVDEYLEKKYGTTNLEKIYIKEAKKDGFLRKYLIEGMEEKKGTIFQKIHSWFGENYKDKFLFYLALKCRELKQNYEKEGKGIAEADKNLQKIEKEIEGWVRFKWKRGSWGLGGDIGMGKSGATIRGVFDRRLGGTPQWNVGTGLEMMNSEVGMFDVGMGAGGITHIGVAGITDVIQEDSEGWKIGPSVGLFGLRARLFALGPISSSKMEALGINNPMFTIGHLQITSKGVELYVPPYWIAIMAGITAISSGATVLSQKDKHAASALRMQFTTDILTPITSPYFSTIRGLIELTDFIIPEVADTKMKDEGAMAYLMKADRRFKQGEPYIAINWIESTLSSPNISKPMKEILQSRLSLYKEHNFLSRENTEKRYKHAGAEVKKYLKLKTSLEKRKEELTSRIMGGEASEKELPEYGSLHFTVKEMEDFLTAYHSLSFLGHSFESAEREIVRFDYPFESVEEFKDYVETLENASKVAGDLSVLIGRYKGRARSEKDSKKKKKYEGELKRLEKCKLLLIDIGENVNGELFRYNILSYFDDKYREKGLEHKKTGEMHLEVAGLMKNLSSAYGNTKAIYQDPVKYYELLADYWAGQSVSGYTGKFFKEFWSPEGFLRVEQWAPMSKHYISVSEIDSKTRGKIEGGKNLTQKYISKLIGTESPEELIETLDTEEERLEDAMESMKESYEEDVIKDKSFWEFLSTDFSEGMEDLKEEIDEGELKENGNARKLGLELLEKMENVENLLSGGITKQNINVWTEHKKNIVNELGEMKYGNTMDRYVIEEMKDAVKKTKNAGEIDEGIKKILSNEKNLRTYIEKKRHAPGKSTRNKQQDGYSRHEKNCCEDKNGTWKEPY